MKRFKKAKKNNKGFSLVELIVVIAIMAVLVGVLAPTLIGNIEKSRESKDLQNLDSIRQAVVTALANEAAYNEVVTSTGTSIAAGGNGSALSVPATYSAFSSEFSSIITTAPQMTSTQGKSGVLTITISSTGAVEVGVKGGSAASGYVQTAKVKDSSNAVIDMVSK